ncbi:metal-dependent hydrolase [Sanyastnella coralliicola]|uniref:metal-dependent hydrolase n=1 Tax=Sanyastnella coralliicola TaxID=3069118 RepID=UPI0027B9F6F6|nr:metal-dependent hydrolase [Longitalea sp. SCSIO 12813]
MKFTWFGHASFSLEMGGKQLVFDPFITPNEQAKSIDVNAIPADYVLLSHGHADHVADAEAILTRTGATLISNYEIVSWYGEKGIENAWPMNHGGKHQFDFGTVRYVNAVHSSVLPDGTYGGNPGGFIIEADGRRIYYAGDTALHMDMELIGRYWKPDLAILPIGDNFTMGIEDAIICCDMIQCDKVIGVHYNTFPFINIDSALAKKAFAKAGKELILPGIGESKEV